MEDSHSWYLKNDRYPKPALIPKVYCFFRAIDHCTWFGDAEIDLDLILCNMGCNLFLVNKCFKRKKIL